MFITDIYGFVFKTKKTKIKSYVMGKCFCVLNVQATMGYLTVLCPSYWIYNSVTHFM